MANKDNNIGAKRARETRSQLGRADLEASRISRRLVDVVGVSPGSLADAGSFGRGLRPPAAGGTFLRRARTPTTGSPRTSIC